MTKPIFYKTNDPNIVVRNLVKKETKETYWRIYKKRNDGKNFVDPVKNVSHINRCELCGVLIVTSETDRFCCEAHCNIHLERSSQDFEEKMFDQDIPVRMM